MMLIQAIKNTKTFLRTERWVFMYIILAIFTNLLVFCISIALIWFMLFQSGQSLASLFNQSSEGLFAFLLFATSLLISIVLSLYLFSILTSIANAPVYGHMVDRILIQHMDIITIDNTITWVDTIRFTILHEMKKLFLILVMISVSFVIGLIPLLGAVILLVLTCFQLILISGLDMLEPIFIHQRIPFRAKVMWIISNIREFGIFLMLAGLILPIPIVNIIALPFLHILGIQMWILNENNRLKLGNECACAPVSF